MSPAATKLRAGLLVASAIASTVAAAGCDATAPTPGTIPCANKTEIAVSDACTLQFTGCADKHSYSVECADDACACFTDGKSKPLEGLAECPADAEEMNTLCNFSVQK